MTKARVVTAAALVLAFTAGVPVGWSFNPFHERGGGGMMNPAWLSQELDLSSDQREKMRDIWSNTAREMDGDAGRRASHEKDDQVRAILSDEQKDEYNEIMATFRSRKHEIDDSRRERHETAIEETMAILTEDQQEAFKHILVSQKKRGRGGPKDGGKGKRP